MRQIGISLCVSLVLAALAGTMSYGQVGDRKPRSDVRRARPNVIRDLLWVWGNPEMATVGKHTPATFAQASPAERAILLGVPNIVMAGQGVPNNDQMADAWTLGVSGFSRLVWEISADGEGGPRFVFEKRMAQVRRLIGRYPKIEAVLLDDMSTVKIDQGFKPEHIRQVRKLLSGKCAAIDLWGVWYTMTFDREGIEQYIKELDVINLWTWHAKDVANLDKNVAHCEQRFPEKPIVLGLYLYDYGRDRRMPMDLLKLQCETALKLAHARRIEGIVFLTITNDAEAVSWAAEWIKRVGNEKLGSPSAAGEGPSVERTTSQAAFSPFRLVSHIAPVADTPQLKSGDASELYDIKSDEGRSRGAYYVSAECLPWGQPNRCITGGVEP